MPQQGANSALHLSLGNTRYMCQLRTTFFTFVLQRYTFVTFVNQMTVKLMYCGEGTLSTKFKKMVIMRSLFNHLFVSTGANGIFLQHLVLYIGTVILFLSFKKT